MGAARARYMVDVYVSEKSRKVPKEVTSELKGALSGKMMSRMKKEAVRCPVVNDEVAFLVCFACPSFLRRVKGVVHCAGGDPPRYYLPG
jgi:hypothetical protein